MLAACGPISTVTYSDKLDALAYSGVKGVIYMLDLRTKLNSGSAQATEEEEIVMLNFNEKHSQLISLSLQGTLILWDA